MKIFQHTTINLLFIICLAFIFNACTEPDWYLEPPQPPHLTPPKYNGQANTTIAELKAMHVPGELDSVLAHVVISGFVVSNDNAGNYYQTLTIQDATGGIEIKINNSRLYNTYALGQKVFVECKGLLMGDYGGMEQLGWSGNNNHVGNIADSAQSKYLFLDGFALDTVKPIMITDYAQLSSALVCKFVKFENVSFVPADTGEVWAGNTATNRTLQINGGTVLVRTSNRANFNENLVPSGTGTIQGVLTIFNGIYQLMLRDLQDVQF